METYSNDAAKKHPADAQIFTNRDAGFTMLAARYRASKPDHRAAKHGQITLTRAALASTSFESQTIGPFPVARSLRYVADLFRRERLTEGNQVLVPSTGSITSTAAMTLGGDDTPEFSPDFEPAAVRTGSAAVHSKATQETVDDVVAFSNWMRTELVRQLLVTVDDQLINGDGNSPNVLGLLNWTPAIPTAASLKAAVSAVLTAGYMPNAILMSPDDFVDLADTDEIGWNGTVYGLPVVPTTAVADDAPIVGDFQTATIFEKYGPTFEISKYNEDDFIMNLVTARAHTRFLLAVPAVAAFCVVTGA
jgi:hypothetical protein